MADIAKSGIPSLSTVGPDPGACKHPPLLAGELIAAGDACYIKSDGLVWRASGAGSTGISAPSSPALATAASGGTVAAGIYTVAVTYVNPAGETVASGVSDIETTGATSTITVTSPAAAGSGGSAASAYKVYMSPVNGGPLALQNGAGTAIATPFVLTAPPATGTALPPSVNTTVGSAAKVRGFAPTKANAGEPITLMYHVVFNYGSGLTPGADYYLSSATPGALADAASTGGVGPIAYAIDATRIYVRQSMY